MHCGFNASKQVLTFCSEVLFIYLFLLRHLVPLHDLISASHPVILKVVATLLKNSSPSAELMEVRRLFLSDMIKLFSNSRENRR